MPVVLSAGSAMGLTTSNGSSFSSLSGATSTLGSSASLLSNVASIGDFAYTSVTEGISAAIADTTAGEMLSSVGSSLFGNSAAGTAAVEAGTGNVATSSMFSGALTGLGSVLGIAGIFAAGMAWMQQDDPDPEVYVQSPVGGMTYAEADETGNDDTISDLVASYFDNAFSTMDDVLDASIESAVEDGSFRVRLDVGHFEDGDTEELLSGLVEKAFSGEDR
jgi:hypothetical protein